MSFFCRSEINKKVLEIFYARKDFFCHPIHYGACFLDARQQVTLTENEITLSVDKILEVGSHMGIAADELLIDIGEYRAREKIFKSNTLWDAAKKMNPVTWWKGLCGTRSLALVAERILNFPATSAAAERNFKTFSLIKTKKRNRLTEERTEKLVFLKSNMKYVNLDLQVLELNKTQNENENQHEKLNDDENKEGMNETETESMSTATSSYASDSDMDSYNIEENEEPSNKTKKHETENEKETQVTDNNDSEEEQIQ